MRNFLTILMLSQGVPMMVMGDEARQTQFGNNNAYCQDNEITWFDWTRTTEARRPVPVHQQLIAFRKRHPTCGARLSSPARSTIAAWPTSRGTAAGSTRPAGTIRSRGCWPSRWAASGERSTQATTRNDVDIHVMMNMDWEDLDFDIPAVPGRRWYRAIDTAAPSPHDIAHPAEASRSSGDTYRVKNRSIVVLISR